MSQMVLVPGFTGPSRRIKLVAAGILASRFERLPAARAVRVFAGRDIPDRGYTLPESELVAARIEPRLERLSGNRLDLQKALFMPGIEHMLCKFITTCGAMSCAYDCD